MKTTLTKFAVAALLALTGCTLTPGCISIQNHIHMGEGVRAVESEATMGRALGGTNDVSGTVRGGVAINSAIYSHKVISPDTTATLAK